MTPSHPNKRKSAQIGGMSTMPTKKRALSENDVRPDRLAAGMKKALLADVQRMKSKRNGFVQVRCPACDSNKKKSKFKKYGMTIVECLTCGSYYTNPRPTLTILDWYYKDSQIYIFWDKYLYPASEKARRERIVVPWVDTILRLSKELRIQTNSLLDIGPGHGTFCEEMASRKVFKNIVAIEPSKSLAKTCEKKGIRTINELIENVHFRKNELFDVAVSFEVLDILFSPKQFILACKKALKKGGLFVFTIRNNKGFESDTLGDVSTSIVHTNLNYFNANSIQVLLKKCGFETVHVLTPGRLDADIVRKKILSGEFDVSTQPFLKQVLIDKWDTVGENFQKFLAENGMSTHMMVVAKKK